MAERIVSPGVFTREKDLSFLPQGIAEIGAALIGPTKKGPAFVPTIIRNFQEFEEMRYMVDRRIIEVHTNRVFDESYAVDFAETSFPDDWSAEKDKLLFMLENGIMTQKELMRHFNPDLPDIEIDQKMEEIEQEQPQEPEEQTPAVPTFEGLRKLGEVN